MRIKIRSISILFVALALTTTFATAQINRTLETKVVDLLAQLPADDLEHTDRLMQEAIELGEDGIMEFTTRLVPAGEGNDTQVRYFVHSLATYAGRGETVQTNNVVETSLQKAIDDSKDQEVKTFLMERLAFCGTEGSVEFLSAFLEEEDYYKTALSVLTSIGNESAARMVLNELSDSEMDKQWAFAEALGKMRYAPANDSLIKLSESTNWTTVRYSLRAMSEIADPESYKPLTKTAKLVKYKTDEKDAVVSLINFGARSLEKGNVELAEKTGEQLLKNCKQEGQLHFRSAGLHLFRETEASELNELLLEEFENKDFKYRGAVLELADETVMDAFLQDWIKAFQKSPTEAKTQLLRYLGKRNTNEVFSSCLLPAMGSNNEELRTAGIKAMAYQEPVRATEALTKQLSGRNSDQQLLAIEETLLRLLDREGAKQLANELNSVSEDGKIVIVKVLGSREVTDSYEQVKALLPSGSEGLDLAVYEAMATIGGPQQVSDLLTMLDKVEGDKNVEALQGSLIQIIDGLDTKPEKEVLAAYGAASNPGKYLPLMVALESEAALAELENVLVSGSKEDRIAAIEALGSWRTNEAIPLLFGIASSGEAEEDLRAQAYSSYLGQVVSSSHPDDQKLLLIRKIYPYHKNSQEKKMVVRAAGTVKTFSSLVFVSRFLDEEEMVNVASNTAIRIALPTPVSEGLSGEVVRDIVSTHPSY